MMTSLDETPVSGSEEEGGTMGEPKKRSTEPSLYTRIRLGSSVCISLVQVDLVEMGEAIRGTEENTGFETAKQ